MIRSYLQIITLLVSIFTILCCKENQFYYEDIKLDDSVFGKVKRTKSSEQIVGIDVKDTSLFYLYFRDYYDPMYFGVGIYTFYCLRCHEAYPITKEIFRPEYLNVDFLYAFIKSESHMKNPSENGMDELNKEEIFLILKYIKGESE